MPQPATNATLYLSTDRGVSHLQLTICLAPPDCLRGPDPETIHVNARDRTSLSALATLNARVRSSAGGDHVPVVPALAGLALVPPEARGASRNFDDVDRLRVRLWAPQVTGCPTTACRHDMVRGVAWTVIGSATLSPDKPSRIRIVRCATPRS
jgi:hypothetical protein